MKELENAKAALLDLLDRIDPSLDENPVLLLQIKELSRLIDYYYAVERGEIDVEGQLRTCARNKAKRQRTKLPR